MTETYHCPNGHPTRFGARFCDECGVALTWPAIESEPAPKPRARDFFRDFTWTGCLVVVAAGFAIYILAQCVPSMFGWS